MIGPRNERVGLLLSKTINWETFIEQTHRKAEKILELKVNISRKTIHFNPPTSIKGSCIIGLTSLEVYSSVFNLNTENNMFELYKDSFD